MARTISELFTTFSNAQELILHVLSFLPCQEQPNERWLVVPPLTKIDHSPSYATISRSWQCAVERRTFSSIELKSTELDLFSRMFAPAHRKAGLRSLKYQVVLPTYDDSACAVFESTDDQDANDNAFSDAVHGLFAVLNSWPESLARTQLQNSSAPLALYIEVYSPYDRQHRGLDLMTIHQDECKSGKREDLWDDRYKDSVIRLKKWEELPDLPRVVSFKVWAPCGRVVEPQSVARVTSKFPFLQKVSWILNDDNKDANVRQQLRSDFAASLKLVPHEQLTTFLLIYHKDAPKPILNSHRDLARQTAKSDELSVALSKMTNGQQLREICLGASISLDFYSLPSPNAWLKLEELMIQFDINTPEGACYFDMGLVHPVTDKMLSLLIAFANAITYMPVLGRAELCANLPVEVNHFLIKLLKSGEEDNYNLDSEVKGLKGSGTETKTLLRNW